MALYFTIILVAIVLLVGIDSLFVAKIFKTRVITFISTIFMCVFIVVFVNVFVALFVGVLPRKWFKKQIFPVTTKEQKFYEKIKIKKWKDKVWELGWLGGFSKSKIKNPSDKDYIGRFIEESNKGMLDHFLRIIFGFCIVLIFPKYVWSVCVPIALVNTFLNFLPIMILRYNLPKLIAIKQRLNNKSKKNLDNDFD